MEDAVGYYRPVRRALFDATHAADVWTLGSVEQRLRAEGVETLWLSRPGKDSVDELLAATDREFVVGPVAGTTRGTLLAELVRRDAAAVAAIRRFRPDLMVTRSPSGVHAARACGIPVLYDTDDGDVAGLAFWIAGPLADVLASPEAITRDYGRNHHRYRGYKELTYLHPDSFTPDPSIRDDLGVGADERLYVLRLSSFLASHDVAERGLDAGQIDRVATLLQQHGRLVVSCQDDVPEALADFQVEVPVERYHHLLAAADLVVGDSQTACSEAAVLGRPSIRYTSFAGRHYYQNQLEQRWGLTRAFGIDQEREFFAAIDEVLDDPARVQKQLAERRNEMLAWGEDVTGLLTTWAHELADGGRRWFGRRQPVTSRR